MALDSAYITNCLAGGFTVTQIADSLGVTPSAVTQHAQAAGLYEKVAELMGRRQKQAASIDERLANIEERAAKALEASITMIADPMKLVRILQVVNAAKRRSIPEQQQVASSAPVVLNLPSHITANFHFNAQNEAVAIGERPLVTLPATEAAKMLKTRRIQHEPASATDW